MIDTALKIAAAVHAGQKDLAGMPYILHPLTVMSMVDSLDEKVVALLHDVIEDSATSLNDLRLAGFSGAIVQAVGLLTKPRPYVYMDYIKAISESELARVVKIADLAHNMDLSRLPDSMNMDKAMIRQERYIEAMELLVEAGA